MDGKGPSNMKETHNGVQKEGNWEDITEFAEEVKDALGEIGVEKKSLEQYQRWRPRKDEGKKEVKQKTVDVATDQEKKIEEKSNGVREDIEEASENIAEAGKKVKKRESPNEELKDASKQAVKPFFSKAAGTIRKIEKKVYSRLMIPLNDYYFDSEDVAVDMKDKNNGEYQMDVKMTEKDKKEKMQEKLREKE